jgi:hypothetical protein
MPQTNEYQDIHFEDPIKSDTEYGKDTIQDSFLNTKESTKSSLQSGLKKTRRQR